MKILEKQLCKRCNKWTLPFDMASGKKICKACRAQEQRTRRHLITGGKRKRWDNRDVFKYH